MPVMELLLQGSGSGFSEARRAAAQRPTVMVPLGAGVSRCALGATDARPHAARGRGVWLRGGRGCPHMPTRSIWPQTTISALHTAAHGCTRCAHGAHACGTRKQHRLNRRARTRARQRACERAHVHTVCTRCDVWGVYGAPRTDITDKYSGALRWRCDQKWGGPSITPPLLSNASCSWNE